MTADPAGSEVGEPVVPGEECGVEHRVRPKMCCHPRFAFQSLVSTVLSVPVASCENVFGTSRLVRPVSPESRRASEVSGARSSRRNALSVSPWLLRLSKFTGSRNRSDFEPLMDP